MEALLRSAAGPSERLDERKVRAAQGTPLLKVEAVGDGWSGEKKTTANGWAEPSWCLRKNRAKMIRQC